jgi:hypothetical protein
VGGGLGVEHLAAHRRKGRTRIKHLTNQVRIGAERLHPGEQGSGLLAARPYQSFSIQGESFDCGPTPLGIADNKTIGDECEVRIGVVFARVE